MKMKTGETQAENGRRKREPGQKYVCGWQPAEEKQWNPMK